MNRPRLATIWLDGCSGCHMSFLDLDERLVEIAERAELVYSPLIDVKEYPEGVDVCLVEGAVASEADLLKIRRVRDRTRTLVSFGDCAVTSNVPGMRNPIGPQPLLARAYLENVTAERPGPVAGRAPAAAESAAGARRRRRRRVPARLPAVGRPDLHRPRRPARRPAAGPVAPGPVRPVGAER